MYEIEVVDGFFRIKTTDGTLIKVTIACKEYAELMRDMLNEAFNAGRAFEVNLEKLRRDNLSLGEWDGFRPTNLTSVVQREV